MTEYNKLLIEQTLFGMNDEALQGEDYLIEAIDQYLDNIAPKYTMNEAVMDSIQYSDTFSKYVPLIESVDEIKTVEKDLNEIKSEDDENKKDKLFIKLTKSIKKAVNWWYKVDPETKAKTFRLMSKIIFSAVMFIIGWKTVGVKSIIGAVQITKNKPSKITLDDKIANKVSKVIKPNEIGLSKKMTTISKTGKNAKLKISWCAIILDVLKGIIDKIDKEMYYHINLVDLDENIKKYDNMVSLFDEAIDEETDKEIITALEKGKRAAVNALRDLLLVREEKQKRDKRKKTNKEEK